MSRPLTPEEQLLRQRQKGRKSKYRFTFGAGHGSDRTQRIVRYGQGLGGPFEPIDDLLDELTGGWK